VQVQAPAADPEAETWAAAEDAKTAESYQAYLDAWPQGRYAVAARIKLKGLQKPAASAAVSPAPTSAPVAVSSASENPETAMWNEVKASGVREYLDAYLKQYPKGKYVALARIELKKLDERDKAQRAKETTEKQQALERERQEVLRIEQLAWDEAKSAAGVAAYASYLQRYPKGRYAALAQAALPKLQREAAEREKLEAVQRQQALERQRVETEKTAAVELALWERIKNSTDTEPFQSYLRQYPQGKYVAPARTELKKLEERDKVQREKENARYVQSSPGNDRRSPDTIASDDEIALRTSNRITEKHGDRVHVNVTSYNRLVLLTGEVPSNEDRTDVEKIAASVANVRSLSNNLIVAEPSGFGARSNDAYITSRVKARLVDSKMPPNRIRVVTEGGRVFLMGLVTQAEANAAVEIARTTGGVKQVFRTFEIVRTD
jgi:osmotically-inducible protein OsmY